MQEDKEAIFNAVIQESLSPIFTKMLDTMRIKRMNSAKGGFTNATDMADYLVKKGIPFRDAHEIIGRMVSYCLDKNISIDNLSMDEFKSFSSLIEEDVYTAICLETCVNERKTPGGPSKISVMSQIDNGRVFINSLKA